MSVPFAGSVSGLIDPTFSFERSDKALSLIYSAIFRSILTNKDNCSFKASDVVCNSVRSLVSLKSFNLIDFSFVANARRHSGLVYQICRTSCSVGTGTICCLIPGHDRAFVKLLPREFSGSVCSRSCCELQGCQRQGHPRTQVLHVFTNDCFGEAAL